MRSAVQAVRAVNDSPLALLHCVLEYPTPYEHANLSRIASITREFPDVIVGYSDHCKPDPSAEVVKTAYVLGARIVEKHFTLDKTLPGNDHYHAMDPSDARTILEACASLKHYLAIPRYDIANRKLLQGPMLVGLLSRRRIYRWKRDR